MIIRSMQQQLTCTYTEMGKDQGIKGSRFCQACQDKTCQPAGN